MQTQSALRQLCALVCLGGLLLCSCSQSAPSPAPEDVAALRESLSAAGIEPLSPPPSQPAAKVELGRMLYFDRILSGNKDISCATCHNPRLGLSDGLPTSIGTGAVGSGRERRPGDGDGFITRNAQDIFNRGDPRMVEMFWDNRVSGNHFDPFADSFGQVSGTPLDSGLAEQALLPGLMRNEQLGRRDDIAVDGSPNELAALGGFGNPQGVWDAQMLRLLAIEEYRGLFAAAYPEVADGSLNFAHAANAIAAFEAEAFASVGSPFDQFVSGDDSALSPRELRGALLFYGRAGCADCHSGNLLSDLKTHAIGVPQIGPGQLGGGGADFGRGRVSGSELDNYAFRTPPLRNVALTAPYMHDGCYDSLADAIRQHLDPLNMLRGYDPSQLPKELRDTYRADETLLADMEARLDPLLASPPVLSEDEVDDLLAFMHALTDPAMLTLGVLIPERVPSGLPTEP